ncbi:GPI inositol-deacylase [Massilia sp. IC2-476]|uniref:GPI inositol-deacylase n=1 Tax=Massilia sp. IC2-476 TaxID=2887199 RepID=UPI001D10FAAB|nr:GPI inositol-deacylase [Massilia sp. IC2-476]MCC2974532.1 GPI inositol-deacylase [Massilia sp. IC2-476]
MREPTRPLPSLVPLPHGGWEVNSYMSSAEYTIRGLGLMPPNSIIPVIVVPGVMGTNLRAKRKPRLGRLPDERNAKVAPGEPVWRPPNGMRDGAFAASDWDSHSPRDRQLLFDAPTLEVDDGGAVVIPDADDGYLLTEQEVRARGWGEVHADSYGKLLLALQRRLNQTFEFDDGKKKRSIKQHWKEVIDCDPKKWGLREFEPLTEPHLENHAKHYFPVYSVGYCWLDDCEKSSRRLEQRILEIIDSWKQTKRSCEQVILVTHSMGGLVARACAKRIPDKIAGVIHGVMPVLGAPAAYRRLAFGTESSSPSNNPLENLVANGLAKVLGNTTQKTTPVLAVSPGALELLPNQRYPQPWLHVRILKSLKPVAAPTHSVKDDIIRYKTVPYDVLHLPNGKVSNPYDLYRDTSSWYRLIDPSIADPAGKYKRFKRGITEAIENAIATAEKFHDALGSFYHPNTYAFYGDDRNKLSFGQISLVAHQQGASATAFTAANIASARFIGRTARGQRRVLVENKTELQFEPEPQDARGDGTVPHQSGEADLTSKVKKAFATQGYDHQSSYNDDDMVMLTLRLIVKIVQGSP